jgi:hypothetical protein
MKEEERGITTTLNRNNNNNNNITTRVILDASRKTPNDHRFTPPLNSILAGFAVAIVPCTTPRSYAAPLPPSI